MCFLHQLQLEFLLLLASLGLQMFLLEVLLSNQHLLLLH